jgi:hypothetical protein
MDCLVANMDLSRRSEGFLFQIFIDADPPSSCSRPGGASRVATEALAVQRRLVPGSALAPSYLVKQHAKALLVGLGEHLGLYRRLSAEGLLQLGVALGSGLERRLASTHGCRSHAHDERGHEPRISRGVDDRPPHRVRLANFTFPRVPLAFLALVPPLRDGWPQCYARSSTRAAPSTLRGSRGRCSRVSKRSSRRIPPRRRTPRRAGQPQMPTSSMMGSMTPTSSMTMTSSTPCGLHFFLPLCLHPLQ